MQSALKATKKTIIATKLKRFLERRPTQEDLYQRNILTNNPYQPLPPKLSTFYKIQQAFEKISGTLFKIPPTIYLSSLYFTYS